MVYDLYGVVCGDLAEARSQVEAALGVSLAAHESSYRCGDYYRYNDAGQEHFILQRNYDSFDDEWTVPEREDMPVLLYVNETSRADELRQRLERVGGVLLQRQEL